MSPPSHSLRLPRFPRFPRGPRWGLVTAALLTGLLGACEPDKSKRERTKSGDYITRERGVAGRSNVPALLGATRPIGGGAVARLLIQPLDDRYTRGRYIRVLYVAEPAKVAWVRQVLSRAQIAPFRTCKPTWRVDLRYGHHELTARVNIPCQRLDLDGRALAYDDAIAKVVGPYLNRALRAPTHRLLRVRVPAEHEPRPILKALSTRTVEAYLPDRPVRRGPWVPVLYSVTRKAPDDPARLDEAVADMRRAAYGRLRAYAQQLKISRHEVVAVLGPEPVYERFNDRRFEARYRVTVLFKPGTPKYMVGVLGLGPGFTAGRSHPAKFYRIDVVFGGKERYARMRKTLNMIKLKPPLRPW